MSCSPCGDAFGFPHTCTWLVLLGKDEFGNNDYSVPQENISCYIESEQSAFPPAASQDRIITATKKGYEVLVTNLTVELFGTSYTVKPNDQIIIAGEVTTIQNISTVFDETMNPLLLTLSTQSDSEV